MQLWEDKYGLYNDKIVHDGEPSGNDGPILTAYAEKLGLSIDREKLKLYWESLEGKPIPIERLPGKRLPPPSRDTILGWFWLGFLSAQTLREKNWNFCPWPLPEKNYYQTFCALWRIRNAHRNALWQNGGEPYLWRYAFSTPFHDRAYMLKASGLRVPVLYRLMEIVYKLRGPKSASSRRIFWRKYSLKASDPDRRE